MSQIITLPSGNTVVLRDPSTFKVKDQKKVFAHASDQEGIVQALSIIDGLIAVLVESWSFDLIPPSIKIESLDELDIPDYNMLSQEAQKVQSYLFPSTNQTPATESDPKADTGELNA
jgi:hypothetical protein